MDFFLNGQANGDVASQLMQANFDPSALRPFVGNDGRQYVDMEKNGSRVAVPVHNANATLRKDEWKTLDTAIVKAAKPRLRVVADLRAAGLTYTIPNGMGKTVLQTEAQSDITDAVTSMDGLHQGQADRPVYSLTNLPLPIIHKDFFFSARQVMTSRNGGSPLDTTTAELAARKVAEGAEKLALGVASEYVFGGGTIYGLANFTSRLTKSMTLPTASAWTGKTVVTEILQMKQQSMNAYHYGPWVLYTSPSWDQYLDEDYSSAKGDNTVRERIAKIEGIQAVRTADYLTDYQMILVQQTSDVVREVIGMDITTVQWPSQGGMQINFKVMAILVPQVRADHNGKTGIVHGTAA